MKQKLKKYKEKVENILSKTNKFITKNNVVILQFIIVFILLYFQHSQLAMYFDDFGNASLSYGQDSKDIIGTNYTLKQLFDWDIVIYNTWGGRILYATIFLIPMLKHGISLYMLCQTFVITAIMFTIYKIVNIATNKDNKYIPFVLIILYSLIDMVYLREGIYWASASILYIWPLLPLFIYIYLFMKTTKKIKKDEKINYYILIPVMLILNFFAAFSHEQIGISVIVFTILYAVLEHRKEIKKFLLLDIPNIVVAIIGYVLLIAAPGNWVRMDSNADFSKLSFFQKITKNYPNIIKSIFDDEMKIFMMLLTIIFLGCIIVYHKKLKFTLKKALLLVGTFCVITLICLICQHYYKNSVVIYGSIWIVYIGIIEIIYYTRTKRAGLISISIAACSTVFCLILSPVVGGRTVIPFMIFIFLLIVLFLADLVKESNLSMKALIVIAFIPITIMASSNYLKIYEGYKENYALEKHNYNILSKYKNTKKKEKTIALYVYPDSWYGATRSYDYDGMNHWIKKYFNIPEDVQFKWVNIYESK